MEIHCLKDLRSMMRDMGWEIGDGREEIGDLGYSRF
jgi:hypothetical protein